ncbi:6-4-DNA photolyase [Nymphaea thermarum]|nr:6-4-DNA photolyase [Nymphaea thermarum]
MEAVNSLLWFRKCLRLHDNPALEHACRNSIHLYPVFVLDSWYLDPDPTAFSPGSARAGVNRIQFMLESLDDLDCSLKKLGSRLLLFKGDAADVIIKLLKRWNIGKLCFEFDTEPYGLNRDRKVKDFASSAGIEVLSPVSHTLFNPEEIIQKNGGKPPLTYQSFLKLAGSPQLSIALPPQKLPSLGDFGECDLTSVPRINELGYGNLRQFGCLSSRYFYQRLQDVYKSVKNHTSPPVSLVGQLLWRDFFYTVGFGTPNFDQMKGNRICKQIPWNEDDALFVAWREAKTGYPWIDAVMVQV